MQDHRCEDHPWNAHQTFAYDESGQSEPHGIFDPVPDDLAVQEILQLVQSHEEDERSDREVQGNRDRDGYNDRVADHVADDRDQAAEEGHVQ